MSRAPTTSLPAAEETTPSLKASIHDGVSYAVMVGAAEAYFGAFGIYLGATTLQIGLLATVPPLIGALCQWAGAIWMDRLATRRRALVTAAIVQAFACLPMGLVPFVLGRGTGPTTALIGLASLYFAAYGFAAPIWSSLIGDLVPPAARGRFFGRRNRLTGASTFGALLASGGILEWFQRLGRTSTGFLIAFIIGWAARLRSALWLARHDDPPWRILPEEKFTFGQFLRRSPWSNFAKFVFFFAAIYFGTAFSAPYFALYMLRDLRFSYLEYTIVSGAATITQFFAFSYWGYLSDRYGNKKILNLCGWGVGVVPILWLFSRDQLYIIAIQVFGGFVWAGFTLAAANFLFDAVSPPKRARCAAYQAVVHGTFVCLGSLAGAAVAIRVRPHLRILGFDWTPFSPLLVVFLVSGLLRFLGAAIFLGRFKEVRTVEPIEDLELFYRVTHLKPIAGVGLNLLSELPRIRRRKGGGDRGGP